MVWDLKCFPEDERICNAPRGQGANGGRADRVELLFMIEEIEAELSKPACVAKLSQRSDLATVRRTLESHTYECFVMKARLEGSKGWDVPFRKRRKNKQAEKGRGGRKIGRGVSSLRRQAAARPPN